MPLENGVNASGSLPDKTSQGQIPSGEGQSPSGQENNGMTGETYQQLLQKKDKAIEELREKYETALHDKLEEKQERYEELQSKSRLTVADKEELASLEDQMVSIKKDARSAPWLKINEELSTKVANSSVAKFDAAQTEDFVMEKAKAERVPYEQFEKDIVKLMQLVDPLAEMYVSRRAKKAYDLYTGQKEAAKELEKMKENSKQFAERGGANQPRPQSKAELLEGAIGSKRSEMAQMDLLKAIHIGQQEATSK